MSNERGDPANPKRSRAMRGAALGRTAGMLMAALCVGMAGSGTLYAQVTPPAFDRVEEDWELVINETDLVAEGPQITTAMSPTGDTSGKFFAFNLNYRSQPSYVPGGLEVVAFDGEVVGNKSTQHTARLATSGESITWTQSMGISGGILSYEIKNGIGTTWSRFGQGSGTNLSVAGFSYPGTLSGYSPAVSVGHSGAGWQANLVGSMQLVRVRYYSGGQLVALDQTVRPVDLVK
jgi:hypothetical protein